MLVRRQSLVYNSQVASATGIAAPPITDTNPQPTPPITIPIAPTTLVASPSETPLPDATTSVQQPGAAASTPARPTINLGTVIGACLGAVALLILVIVLVVWHSRRSRKSIQLRERRSKGDTWNKLSDSRRDSRRSSFESKPSLQPHSSLEYTTEYPPTYANTSPSQTRQPTQNAPKYVLPAHPYSSSSHSIPTEESPKRSLNDNPFLDPKQGHKEPDSDAASFYSAASNPFESVYVPPSHSQITRVQTPEGYSGSPFFTPHPDSSVQGEKWGSVGKERNVQESYAPSVNGGSDKLGSLIAALDLDGPRKSEEEAKVDRSMHGHLGKFDF